MKKIIIPVIIAATLGVGGGIAAVALNDTNNTAVADIEVSNDLLKPGTYYLNGDVNAEMWIEVNPDFLTLKGTDIDKSLTEAAIKSNRALEQSLKENDIDLDIPEDVSAKQLEELKQLYCADKLYQLLYIGLETMPYIIKVDRDNIITEREELLDTNAGFSFDDKTNTISLSVGEFTLVE